MADRPARPAENRLYRTAADLAPELWADAEARPLAEAVRAAAARLESDSRVGLRFLGGDYRLDFAARAIEAPPGRRPADFQTGLVLLSYLAHAQDIGLAGRQVAPRELNGGEMFFKGPHALATAPVTARLTADPAGLLAKAEFLGLAPYEAGTGTALRGRALPHLELGLILHPADEEFPADLTWTFDAHAQRHLPLDALWALVNVLAEELAA